jgi:2-dehydro-3-deoxy-D-arabinonate dehydratase
MKPQLRLVRFSVDGGPPMVGVAIGESIFALGPHTIGELLATSPARILRECAKAIERAQPVAGQVHLLPPIDGRTEVWAAGVTYKRSLEARIAESLEANVYDRVYLAERAELFFKAPSWRVVTNGDAIGLRADSALNVAEPELAVVVTSSGEIVGYCICNDMSSRSIEGENPLYLPQAKIYDGSCALGDSIVLVSDKDEQHRDITMVIERAGMDVWSGSTSSGMLHREIPELVRLAMSHLAFPEGLVLATGTGIVPELDFSVLAGDVVRISISGLGELTNRVDAVGGVGR